MSSSTLLAANRVAPQAVFYQSDCFRIFLPSGGIYALVLSRPIHGHLSKIKITMKDSISVVVNKDASIQYEYCFDNGKSFGCQPIDGMRPILDLVGVLRALQSSHPKATITVLIKQ